MSTQLTTRLWQLASIPLLLLFLGFGIGTVRTPPPTAPVFVDDQARQFVTPPFVRSHPELVARFQRVSTYGDARAAGMSAEKACNYAECWSQDGRSLTGGFLESIGILPPLRSRWNTDGAWNW